MHFRDEDEEHHDDENDDHGDGGVVQEKVKMEDDFGSDSDQMIANHINWWRKKVVIRKDFFVGQHICVLNKIYVD